MPNKAAEESDESVIQPATDLEVLRANQLNDRKKLTWIETSSIMQA